MGANGPDGYETDDGVALFDSDVESPFGIVENLHTTTVNGKFYITQAPEVTLIRRHLGIDWEDEHASIVTSPFGYEVFWLQADNGEVTYRLVPNEVEWADGALDNTRGIKRNQIGVRLTSNWRFVCSPPPKFVMSTKTKELKMPAPGQEPEKL